MADVAASSTATVTAGGTAGGNWLLAPEDQLLVDREHWLATGKWKPED
jgi:hypothetical protein